MNGKLVAGCGAALLAGAALGWFLKPAPPPSAAPEPAKAAKAPRKIAEASGASEAATIAALRARIADLEAEIKTLGKVSAAHPVAAKRDDAEPGASRREERRLGPRERLAKLEAENPARYAQITNRMERMRRNRAANALAKREYLSSIDTGRMTATAKKTHAELQEAMAKKEALEAKLHDENLTEDQRKALFDEMRATDRTMRELNQSERDTLLAITAQNMGYSGDDANEVVETIKDVIEATESGHGAPHGPPPGEGAAPGNGAPPPMP